MAAALKGNAELIRYIVKVCDVRFSFNCCSSVEECVIRDPKVVKFLARHANVRNGSWSGIGNLLMMSSVCSGLTDCVQYLVDNNIVDLGQFILVVSNFLC